MKDRQALLSRQSAAWDVLEKAYWLPWNVFIYLILAIYTVYQRALALVFSAVSKSFVCVGAR